MSLPAYIAIFLFCATLFVSTVAYLLPHVSLP